MCGGGTEPLETPTPSKKGTVLQRVEPSVAAGSVERSVLLRTYYACGDAAAVDRARQALYTADRNVIQRVNGVITPEEIGVAPNGRIGIQHGDTCYECVYHANDVSDYLYVVFSGARNAEDPLPLHKRWTYYKYIDGAVLNIADPMYRDFDQCMLGWYYGTTEFCYAEQIANLARICADKLEKKQIVFFGSSGGGFAAAYCACCIPGSTAVVINPQIQPGIYYYAHTFEQITGNKLAKEDAFGRNCVPERIIKAAESRFILIENVRSKEDMQQLSYITERLGKRCELGLNSLSEHILVWLYDGDYSPPHNAQEYPEMFFAIDYLIHNFEQRKALLELYLIITELWHNYWENKKMQKNITEKCAKKVTILSNDTGADRCKATIQMCEERMEISPSPTNIWNHCCVFASFKPNATYRVYLGRAEVVSGKCGRFTVLVKDTVTNSTEIHYTVPVGEEKCFAFKTGERTDGLELRVYAGVAGETKNISLRICNVVISALDFE